MNGNTSLRSICKLTIFFAAFFSFFSKNKRCYTTLFLLFLFIFISLFYVAVSQSLKNCNKVVESLL